MILKTCMRVFTNDVDESLKVFEPLHGHGPYMRVKMGEWDIAGIGDVLIVGGTDEALAPIRDSIGPFVVNDLEATRRMLEETGAVITKDIIDGPTGQLMYARHLDGTHVEYVQWTPDSVEKWINAPLREGKRSSQV